MKKNAKPRSEKAAAFDFAPDIGWIVEETSVRVFQAEKGELLRLAYPEAAVWDLIGRHSREADMVPKLAAIGDLSRAAARSLLRACLRDWLRAGILLETEKNG
jgi:hypothetical protein